jgi:hypothetical protein
MSDGLHVFRQLSHASTAVGHIVPKAGRSMNVRQYAHEGVTLHTMQQDSALIVDVGESTPSERIATMTTLQNFETRLAVLERQVTAHRQSALRYRRVCMALLLALIGGACLAAAQARPVADVIRANRIEVLNDAGKLVFAASAGAPGGGAGGQIDLWNAVGRNVLRASVNATGGDLAVWNNAGANVAGLFATPTGGELAVWTASGNRRVRAAGDDRGGRVEVFDAAGKPSLGLAVNVTGGEVEVKGSTGAVAARLAAETGGGVSRYFTDSGAEILAAGAGTAGNGGVIHLANGQGQPVFSAVAEDNGCGRIDVSGDRGEVAASLAAVKDSGGSLSMNNESGKRMFAVGVMPQGGLINVMNASGIPVFIAGYAEAGRGGAVSVKNGRGVQVFSANTDDKENGTVTVWDADGRKPRSMMP